jgi:hypothetical protein
MTSNSKEASASTHPLVTHKFFPTTTAKIHRKTRCAMCGGFSMSLNVVCGNNPQRGVHASLSKTHGCLLCNECVAENKYEGRRNEVTLQRKCYACAKTAQHAIDEAMASGGQKAVDELPRAITDRLTIPNVTLDVPQPAAFMEMVEEVEKDLQTGATDVAADFREVQNEAEKKVAVVKHEAEKMVKKQKEATEALAAENAQLKRLLQAQQADGSAAPEPEPEPEAEPAAPPEPETEAEAQTRLERELRLNEESQRRNDEQAMAFDAVAAAQERVQIGGGIPQPPTEDAMEVEEPAGGGGDDVTSEMLFGEEDAEEEQPAAPPAAEQPPAEEEPAAPPADQQQPAEEEQAEEEEAEEEQPAQRYRRRKRRSEESVGEPPAQRRRRRLEPAARQQADDEAEEGAAEEQAAEEQVEEEQPAQRRSRTQRTEEPPAQRRRRLEPAARQQADDEDDRAAMPPPPPVGMGINLRALPSSNALPPSPESSRAGSPTPSHVSAASGAEAMPPAIGMGIQLVAQPEGSRASSPTNSQVTSVSTSSRGRRQNGRDLVTANDMAFIVQCEHRDGEEALEKNKSMPQLLQALRSGGTTTDWNLAIRTKRCNKAAEASDKKRKAELYDGLMAKYEAEMQQSQTARQEKEAVQQALDVTACVVNGLMKYMVDELEVDEDVVNQLVDKLKDGALNDDA